MASHSVTFRQTQVNTPRLNPSHRPVFNLPTTEGRKAELTTVTTYIPRWFTHRQTVTYLSTNLAVNGRESNSQPVDHKSDALTTTWPSTKPPTYIKSVPYFKYSGVQLSVLHHIVQIPHEFLPWACEWQTVLDLGRETEHGNVTPAFLEPQLSEAGHWWGPTIQHIIIIIIIDIYIGPSASSQVAAQLRNDAANASANTAVAWMKLNTVSYRI